MNNLKPKAIKAFALFIVGFLFSFNLYATWSIIAVDNETGKIGMAGASCTRNVRGIGEYVPGRGIVVVQAMSNNDPRELGIKMIKEGASAEEILSAMRNNKFDPEKQQYGVIIVNNNPVTYSGKLITDWNGSMIGNNFAVLGNTLVSESVVKDAFQAFNNAADKQLSERLMLALIAGAEAGGDRRCGEQHATSAFVTVYNPNDKIDNPYINLYVTEMDRGAESAVLLLANEFEQWQKNYTNNLSTQIKVIPEKEPLLYEDNKMKVHDFSLVTLPNDSSLFVYSYSEAPEKGLIPRDRFVDLSSEVKLYFLNETLKKSELSFNDYKIKSIKEENRKPDIVIKCIMDKIGLNIEIINDGSSEKITVKWDEL